MAGRPSRASPGHFASPADRRGQGHARLRTVSRIHLYARCREWFFAALHPLVHPHVRLGGARAPAREPFAHHFRRGRQPYPQHLRPPTRGQIPKPPALPFPQVRRIDDYVRALRQRGLGALPHRGEHRAAFPPRVPSLGEQLPADGVAFEHRRPQPRREASRERRLARTRQAAEQQQYRQIAATSLACYFRL